jgi:hypothetical protein
VKEEEWAAKILEANPPQPGETIEAYTFRCVLMGIGNERSRARELLGSRSKAAGQDARAFQGRAQQQALLGNDQEVKKATTDMFTAMGLEKTLAFAAMIIGLRADHCQTCFDQKRVPSKLSTPGQPPLLMDCPRCTAVVQPDDVLPPGARPT